MSCVSSWLIVTRDVNFSNSLYSPGLSFLIFKIDFQLRNYPERWRSIQSQVAVSVWVSSVLTSAAASPDMFTAFFTMLFRSESFSCISCFRFQIRLTQASLYISLQDVSVGSVANSAHAFLNNQLKQSWDEHSLWHVHELFLLRLPFWKTEAASMIFSFWSYVFHPTFHA